MITTIKGLKDILSKVVDDHKNKLNRDHTYFNYYKNCTEREYYDKVVVLLENKINTYSQIQELTQELIKVTLKFKEAEVIEAYMFYMDKDYYDND